MRRWQIYLAGLVVLLLLPEGQGQDVSELRPAELVYINKEAYRVQVSTDMGDSGIGIDLAAAVKDMQENAPGEVFLDTAEYVLVTEETKHLIPELKRYLRPGIRVALAAGEIDPETAPAYLRAHKPSVLLKDCILNPQRLEKLMTAGGQYYLE